MTDSSARFTFSAVDGRLEVVGSESFVSKHLEALGDVLRSLLQRVERTPHEEVGTGKAAAGAQSGPPNSKVGGQESLAEYENVLTMADDKVQVIKSIPGSNKADKTVNAALLCLFGNSLRGTEEVSFDTIRDLCQAHSCLDSPNFARALKSAKEYLICSGSGRKQSAKLTVPGKKQAEKLAKELNAQ